MNKISQIEAAVEFAHARGTFQSHLQGTFSILAAWGQPQRVTRTGLLHTSYSGDLFKFYLFDVEEERHRVQDILGQDAESLTFLYGTTNRGQLHGFASLINGTSTDLVDIDQPQWIDHRLEGQYEVNPETTAELLMVTIADYLDQMVDMNGWRDHHQMDVPDFLYPGDGKPAIGLSWMSHVCQQIKPYLKVVPPAFDQCTTTMSISDERRARELYWKVILQEHDLDRETKMDLLEESARLNPFIGEPLVLLSQLHFSNTTTTEEDDEADSSYNNYILAGKYAAEALERFYKLASAWDKRRTFEHWVGFARLMLLRSNRNLDETLDHSLPRCSKFGLVSLGQVVEDMRRGELSLQDIEETPEQVGAATASQSSSV